MERKKGQQNYQHTKATNPLDFYRERGAIVIENENGWANYFIEGELAYLQNMYVYPEKRNKQNGSSLLNQLELSMKELHGCKRIVTTISRIWGDSNQTLLICLKRGFKLSNMTSDAIILEKEID